MRGNGKPCTWVRVSASPTLNGRISKSCHRCCPVCLPPLRGAPSKPVLTGWSCTTPMPTPWPLFYLPPMCAPTVMADRAISAFACRWRSMPRCAKPLAPSMWWVAATWPRNASTGATPWTMRCGLASSLRVRAWTSFQPRAVASLMMPSSLAWGPAPTLTPGAAAMNACPSICPTSKGLLAATSLPRRASAAPSAQRAWPPRWCAPVACTTLTWPRPCSSAATATSWAPPAKAWPTPIGP